VPDFLSHYYEASRGPFRNLSDLSLGEAEAILRRIRKEKDTFAGRRSADYLAVRRDLENQVRQKFIAKGGAPQRSRPHYMILGSCPWLKSWYLDGLELKIPLSKFDPSMLSFTYGDTFPAMRREDGKPYRKQVYTLAELPALIAAYGLPQEWNSEGKLGPDRYIEAQLWYDAHLD
jgi:hypothetical protein